ncbi:MAG TPA: hypothetical protein VK737_12455 [Opitutales bacterium]|nr:hypothetical protein [Opitutales bacterium]
MRTRRLAIGLLLILALGLAWWWRSASVDISTPVLAKASPPTLVTRLAAAQIAAPSQPAAPVGDKLSPALPENTDAVADQPTPLAGLRDLPPADLANLQVIPHLPEIQQGTMTDNGDGTQTLRGADGSTVTISDSVPQAFQVNGDGTMTAIYSNGTTEIQPAPFTPTLTKAANGSRTLNLTDPDGTTETIPDVQLVPSTTIPTIAP